jgi:hypothetical protein
MLSPLTRGRRDEICNGASSYRCAAARLVSPLLARAQQLAPFRRGLQEMGYVEGQNVEIDYRRAEGVLLGVPLFA